MVYVIKENLQMMKWRRVLDNGMNIVLNNLPKCISRTLNYFWSFSFDTFSDIPKFQYNNWNIGGLTNRKPRICQLIRTGRITRFRLLLRTFFFFRFISLSRFLSFFFFLFLTEQPPMSKLNNYLILYCFDNRCTSHLKSHTSAEKKGRNSE